jgi:hypothetical protein
MVSGHVVISVLVLILYVLLTYLAGRLLLAAAFDRVDGMIAAAAPLVGAAAFGLQLWAYGLVHLGWNALTLLLPWALAALLAQRRFRDALRGDRASARAFWRQTRVDRLDGVLIVAGVAIAGVYLLALVTQPITGSDAIAMWLFKAKFFFDHQAIDLSSMASLPPGPTRHLDYPPLFPLMVATVYALIGHVDDILGKGVNFLFLVTGVATVLSLMAATLNRRLVIMFAFVLVAIPLFNGSLLDSRAMGYADYALGILIMISLAHLYRVERGDDLAHAALALLFAGLAALTKNEGLVFLLVVTVLLAVLVIPRLPQQTPSGGTIRRLLGVLALALVPVVVWQALIRSLGFQSDLLAARNWHVLIPALPGRAWTILRFVRESSSVRNDYPWLAISYVLSAVMLAINRFKAGTAVFLAVSAQIASYFLVYLFTPYDLNWHLATSFDRLVTQIAPSLIVLLGLAAQPWLASGTGEREASVTQSSAPVVVGEPAA